MVFFQVIIGGVTRLTGSGLSITKWDIVTGTIPPLSEAKWQEEFGKYQLTPQYKLINQDMNMSEFKFIYFWEFFHRFNARLLGIVFLAGLLYFIYKNWVDRDFFIKLLMLSLPGALIALLHWIMVVSGLINKPYVSSLMHSINVFFALVILSYLIYYVIRGQKLTAYLVMLFLLGALIATLGWIMVASGLIDKPYVSPLKLSTHLFFALIILSYLVWLTVYVMREGDKVRIYAPKQKRVALAVMLLLFIQLFLGGILSGMKAGLAYPTWPTMNGEWIPSALSTLPAKWGGILYYDATAFWEASLIQILHRCTAYLLVIVIIYFFFQLRGLSKDKVFNTGVTLFPFAVLLQATLGIITVIHCIGHVPVLWGVLHQAGAMLLLANTTFIYYHLSSRKVNR